MTNPPSDASPVQKALRAISRNGADEQALSVLAGSEVLLPEPDVASRSQVPWLGATRLPVLRQDDGVQLVPVFTSRVRLEEVFPLASRCLSVQLGELAHDWPSDELSLVIDAGAPEEVALTSQGVRTLLDRED